jgi:N-acetylmuramoyl-L-alanine amidase
MIPTSIILHHSLTADSQTVSWSAIRRYHTKTLGWNDIGYHYGIEKVGDHYEILVGRLMTQIGAHTKQESMNAKSLGICLIGNFDDIEPPGEQFDLSLRLVKSLQFIIGIPTDKVYGHREFASYKTCPGKRFDLDKFRSILHFMPLPV